MAKETKVTLTAAEAGALWTLASTTYYSEAAESSLASKKQLRAGIRAMNKLRRAHKSSRLPELCRAGGDKR